MMSTSQDANPATLTTDASLLAKLARIAIVDDEPLNVRLIRHQLEKLGYRFILGVLDSTTALDSLEEFRPDVVLLDVVMPEVSGTELLQQMRDHAQLKSVPVIVLTASRDRLTKLRVLELGVADFLGKPLDEAELSTRLRNVIEAKQYRDHLKDDAAQLERAVRQRTIALEASRREVVLCLARAAEYRDSNTGRHVIRVGKYASVLASALGFPADFAGMLGLAAQLHDVGKIGIPDSILHKPDRLTEEEMVIMRRHAEYGWKIVAPLAEREAALWTQIDGDLAVDLQSPMLEMASLIAANHHERWDGAGYPAGLKGNEIPLAARITAVADVFDALSTPRCYKPAFPLAECFRIVEAERGKHFDPQVADACLRNRQAFEAIYLENLDEGPAA